jgi:hypothetical protein
MDVTPLQWDDTTLAIPNDVIDLAETFLKYPNPWPFFSRPKALAQDYTSRISSKSTGFARRAGHKRSLQRMDKHDAGYCGAREGTTLT